MVDVSFHGVLDDSGVIQIEVAGSDPVEGWVREIVRKGPDRPARQVSFSGWLGLLQAVMTLIGDGSPQAVGGPGRQFSPGRDADLPEYAS